MVMVNLFEMLKSQERSLTSGFENKKYWEDKTNNFNKNVLGPDGEYYDEEEIYESIKQSDRARLIKFG
jgi:hypothetical protein